jgi:exopolysaccharide biosynthesis polyprenyl glycosylphosphotransferase
MLERSRADYAALRLAIDIFLTGLALFFASPLSAAIAPKNELLPALTVPVYFLAALIWSIALVLSCVYLPRDQRAVDEAQTIIVVVTLSTLALVGVLFFTFPQVSRLQILVFYTLDLSFLIGARLAVRVSLRLKGKPLYPRRRVLILGADQAGQEAAHMIASHRWAGLEAVGFLDDNLPARSIVEGLPILGCIEEVVTHVDSEGIQEIVVALPLQAYDEFFQLIDELGKLPVRVRIIPDHIKLTLFRARAEELAGIPMITLQQPALAPFERQVKRAFDLIAGTIMLVLVLPLLGLIAIAIRLDSPGPIIFRQKRVGENGQVFWMYKFRSMVQDAEQRKHQAIRILDSGRILHKHADDPRVTRVGKLLRRTSLDELPQIVNVLQGEMSLVGPRPELPWLVEHYEPWQWQRFSVPQGITGWWQVNGRSNKPMHLHTEEDLFYIQNYSFLLDIQILWRTIGAVIKSRGAF